jgi:hypothetical protein
VRNAIIVYNDQQRGEGNYMATKNHDQVRGVDPALRQRVLDGMAIASDALDAAVADPSDSNLDELHEATDKLMRALGRVLIEIELQRSLPEP